MDRDQLIEELTDWIETDVIAEAIVESLEEDHAGEEITIQQAKDVWYRVLEYLGSCIGEFVAQ